MTSKKSISSILNWLDENILLVLSGFLIAFIPLYPKIPIFSPIESYVVRVRLEDIFVLLTVIIWGLQLYRKKISWRTPLNHYIGLYLVAGFISLVSAIFIIQTIPMQSVHIVKSTLHFLRYIEYFSLFFIVYTSIRKPQHVKVLLTIIMITVVLTGLYGYGQRHFQWPVYSTMNREYSRGIALELVSQAARVPSTFAGHYDFASYLVIAIPIILSFIYASTKKYQKVLLSLVFLIALWSLMASALRSAFLAYLVTVAIVTVVCALKKKLLTDRIIWGLTRTFAIYLVTLIMLVVFGGNMYQLIGHTIAGYPALYDAFIAIDSVRNKAYKGAIGNNTIVDQYIPPKPKDPGTPPDANENVTELVEVITITPNGETVISFEDRPPIYSECAQKKGLSLCIRLDALWPQALNGFYKNPLVGSGYATLNKTELFHFTEADGVDNNYLRILGETGVLGFVGFHSIIVAALWLAVKGIYSRDALLQVLAGGYFAGTIGLLMVAVLIDVFVASKVAFTFWAVTGMYLGYYRIAKNIQT